jgi:GxxExxY protein
MKYSDITGEVIGCAMKVHSYFGWGFPEIIYQRSLLLELRKLGFKCGSEVEKEVYYNNELVGKRKLDVIVEGKVLIELKAISFLDEASHKQLINYLKIFKIDVGLLLNFGMTSLYYKRFVHNY